MNVQNTLKNVIEKLENIAAEGWISWKRSATNGRKIKKMFWYPS